MAAALMNFTPPIKSYDVHVYFDKHQFDFAKRLREDIGQAFPHLPLFRMHPGPIGPHSTGMFEVDLLTPQDFGAFLPWVSLHRGDLSVLVHPNTGRPVLDHTAHALWMGRQLPVNVEILRQAENLRSFG